MPITPWIKESLDEYAANGRPTGGFLYAVLSNDLMEAVGRADETNRFLLFDICSYIYNHMPISCHGSREKVDNWLEEHRKRLAKLIMNQSVGEVEEETL